MIKGLLIVISAPSGCGKTTIAKAVLEKHPEILFSISATTRPIRSGEVQGSDYFFLTEEEFKRRIEAGDLVEWEEIFGNFYGTLKSEINRSLQNKRIMLFDVDVKGAISIKRNFPDETVLIFIKPPDFEILKKRLTERRTESPEELKKRLERVPMEMEQEKHFRFIVVNDKLRDAVDEVDRIICNEIKKANEKK